MRGLARHRVEGAGVRRCGRGTQPEGCASAASSRLIFASTTPTRASTLATRSGSVAKCLSCSLICVSAEAKRSPAGADCRRSSPSSWSACRSFRPNASRMAETRQGMKMIAPSPTAHVTASVNSIGDKCSVADRRRQPHRADRAEPTGFDRGAGSRPGSTGAPAADRVRPGFDRAGAAWAETRSGVPGFDGRAVTEPTGGRKLGRAIPPAGPTPKAPAVGSARHRRDQGARASWVAAAGPRDQGAGVHGAAGAAGRTEPSRRGGRVEGYRAARRQPSRPS